MNSLYLDQMKTLIPDEFEEYLSSFDNPPRRGIRINSLKTDAQELSGLCTFAMEKHPFCDNGYFVESEESLGRSNAYTTGLFYIQEPSASAAVTVLDPRPGMKVLDLCAAPGSKSTQIAEKLGNTGLLAVNEYVGKRAQILLENIVQNGTANCMVFNNDTKDIAKAFPEYFDAVLCDAPCSGEGMFRKDPKTQDEWSPANVDLCVARQAEILDNAEKCLRPGGILVYSTCTFNMKENELQVLNFLKSHDNMEMVNPGVSFGRRGMINEMGIDMAVRIFPMDGGEGHFIAKMRKKGDASSYPAVKEAVSDRIPKEAVQFLNELLEKPYPHLFFKNGRLYGGINPFIETKGLHLIRSQVFLGEMIKNRFEPSHHFFLSAWSPFKRTADLNDEQIMKYFHGEQISFESEKGYTAVCWKGHPAGGAKSDGKNLKNKYPKQLRIR